MPDYNYSESALIEQPVIELFRKLGWETADCFHEFEQAGGSPLGRETKSEVVLFSRLRPVLEKLNPDIPSESIQQAINEITRNRSLMTPVNANREVYKLIKNGVKVKIPDKDGKGETVETIRVIDWNRPENNDFFLTSQFWITGEMYTRRADLIGFVNGLPLVFIELKAAHKRLKNAFDDNLRDYNDTIPHIFWYNAFIIFSNGSRSKIGSVTAEWEHFSDWKKISNEGEEGIISLDTIIRGTCEPSRLLDLIENFTLFMDVRGGTTKLVAKNHQYLGVNNSIEALKEIKKRKGKLGVFWHTQGSGKSISMIFFSLKVFRKIPGNWTFVVITDRTELDGQIYKNFASSGAVTEEEAQATSSENLRQLLQEDHRYIFTLIHKFCTGKGEKHPVISERPDIIVITDEAHRTQYDTLALNLRTALPNASFIAFTGTPLIVGEEKTRDVFGDYISIYNFKESVDDKATVPLYYENRIPELQLTNENLNEDMGRLLEETELDEEQEAKLEREFAREYHLITREDRIEAISEDIVKHFTGRGFQGKAMVVCVDKATAIKMYDKVQKYWKKNLEELKRICSDEPQDRTKDIAEKIKYMEDTDMAVVVSQAQNEVDDLRKKGVDIIPHRKRMVKEDLDTKFKEPADPFRIVFVCAMWMTGFDVPCCSTIYLDKPMRNHTLMQTIARANRVFRDKINGLIVDYVGVFRNLQKALAIYGSGSCGRIKPGDTPVQDKSVLAEELKKNITKIVAFCEPLGIKLDVIQVAEKFEKVKLLDDAVDAILVKNETKKRFLTLSNNVLTLYKAILPDPIANELANTCLVIRIITEKIRSLSPEADITYVMQGVENLLDKSIATEGYVIRDPIDDQLIDLSKINFDELKAQFRLGHKHTKVEKLKGKIANKLKKMVRFNRSRMDFYEQFQKMIDEYNAGSMNIDEFFNRLVNLAWSLNEEEKRSLREELTEEELAIFDLLTKPEIKLSKKEEIQVKKIAKDLLEKLKKEKLVLDWRKRQQSRAQVRLTVEEILNKGLPKIYTSELYNKKCDVIYQHVYESYYGAGKSVYTSVT